MRINLLVPALVVVPALFPAAGLAAPGDVLQSFPSPGPYPTGLAWDGTSLWVANLRTAYDGSGFPNLEFLARVDPATGQTLAMFPTAFKYFHGLAWDGADLWGDEGYDSIHRVSTASGSVMSTFDSQGGSAYGLTYDP